MQTTDVCPSKDSKGWCDATIRADANGWRDAPGYMYALTPFRRYLFADWYRPIARVGNKWFELYPLVGKCPVKGPVKTVKEGSLYQDKVCMILKPRQKGELFFYLNDGVLFLPGFEKRFLPEGLKKWILPKEWNGIYENNKGMATITVRRLK